MKILPRTWFNKKYVQTFMPWKLKQCCKSCRNGTYFLSNWVLKMLISFLYWFLLQPAVKDTDNISFIYCRPVDFTFCIQQSMEWKQKATNLKAEWGVILIQHKIKSVSYYNKAIIKTDTLLRLMNYYTRIKRGNNCTLQFWYAFT